MNKKIISSILIMVLILSLGSFAFAKTGNEKIDWLVENKFIVGDSSGDLMLDKGLTREEAATIIVKALGKDSLAPSYQHLDNVFTDMNSDVWSNGMVNVAAQEKIVSGFPDKTFGPKKDITYQEIITMLVQVRGGLTENELKGGKWPTPYILKANELGIIDSSMTNLDYTKNATRQLAFELLYNTMKEETEKDLEQYKVMVGEIERVYGIDKNELGVTVFNHSSNSSKYKSNEYTRLKNLDYKEDLLGKVVDVKIDKDNNIQSYTIDNSYDYLTGEVEFLRDRVVLNNKSYSVSSKDSSSNVNDKLQFVYHNEKEVDYKELYDTIDSDFARITVDGNKVIAIESFEFSKVEAIEKLEENRVSFVDGRTIAIDKVLLVEDNVLKSIDISDIEDLDIGHVYGEGKLLVTKESKSQGSLDNIIYDNRDLVIKINGQNYKVSDKFNMSYSTNGDKFIILGAEKVYNDLYSIRGSNIGYGLDVLGNIKYIISAEVKGEDFYIVDRALGNNIRLVDKNSRSVELRTTLQSRIRNVEGRNISLSSLNKGDLVYIIKSDEDIEELYMVKDFNSMKRSSVTIGKDSNGEFALDKRYGINKDTNSFLFHEDSSGIKDIESMEVSQVFKNAGSNSKLKAYIISDNDFDNLKIGDKVITSGDKNEINTILFTGFQQSLKDSKEEIVRLKYRFRSSYDNEIEGFVEDKPVKYKVEKNTQLKDMAADDYIKVFIDGNNEVIGAETIFRNSDAYLEVLDLESSSGKIVEISVRENGKKKSYWVSQNYVELGFVEKGSLVKLAFDKDGDVNIILVK